MRRFGGAKAALHFRKRNTHTEAPDEVEPQRYRLEEGDGTTHAQHIVRELYFRYEKQLQRWRDYRDLFLFLSFMALYLATLYLQRQASIAYQVHSTIESVVVPADDTMPDTDAVYSWVQGILQNVWLDPVCGDGLCEAPFEFASYSRFGCRADCGKLSEIQNLTTIQVDIYYDFSHPVGSMPASDLMQQASWNLCPVDIAYSNQCYFDSDQTFDRLIGEQHNIIDDAPDGQWTLVLKRDIFNKIRGAVRDSKLLDAAAYYYKIYIAAISARAEQNYEISLLQQGIDTSTVDYFLYLSRGVATYTNNTDDRNYNVTSVRMALCQCGSSVIVNSTANATATWDLYWLQGALNNTVDPDDVNTLFTTSYPTWSAFSSSKYCAAPYNGLIQERTNFSDASTLTTVASANMSDWCYRWLNQSIGWRANLTQSVQKLLIDLRLGDQRTTGKIAQRNAVNLNLMTYIVTNMPELYQPIFKDPTGTVGDQDPINARIDILQQLYVDSLYYQKATPVAQYNLTRRNVYAANVTMLGLRARAQARITEVRNQTNDVNNFIPIPGYDKTFANTTVGYIVGTFLAANASNSSVPDANSTLLGSLRIPYNLVAWQGNTSAYMLCNLPSRGAKYVGNCTNMDVSCVATANDTVPYNCNYLSTGQAVGGTVASTSYRAVCDAPCDRKNDCNAICECYNQCSSNQYCQCDACLALKYNAASDTEFIDIRSVVTSSASSASAIADVSTPGGSTTRKLQSTDDQLAAILVQVGAVSSQQSTLATQVTTLKGQVDRANQLAEARASDTTLVDLISSSKAEITAGQAAVQAKLDEIIGKQNQALDLANAAATALASIQELSSKQLEAQQALEKAIQNQVNAIRTATYQNIITLTQALALWKRARRDKAVTLKAAELANLPCNRFPSADNLFTLDNGNIVDTSTARERNVGLTNRVIAGLLLHQTRTNQTLCPESKFDKIQKTCTGPYTHLPYGVDPVFKRGTTSYNPDFDDVDNKIVLQFYNCSGVSGAHYNLTYLNQTVNLEEDGFCAELYNPQGLPYAFHAYPLEAKKDGFPVFYDINLAQDDAQTWFTWTQEGLYLDAHTRTMTAELVTYNAELRIFAYFLCSFYFSDGGSIKVKYRLHTVRIELYEDSADDVRFAMEIIVSIIIICMLLHCFWEMIKLRKRCLTYFLHGWNIVTFCSNSLMFACVVIWWIFVTEYANTFGINLRYDVYQDLQPDANYLAMQDEGANLDQLNSDFNSLSNLIDLQNWYFALNGINILLLIARMLRLMDFQPRLGIVTRSLWLAGPDLIHFAIVAGMVFIGYAMMGNLIFGNAIPEFATFGDSVNTCFEILLGNIAVNDELRALGGLQSVAGALFFWSYELLVYMVLLNFLLAIIVDAFSEVKERTNETIGIHTELWTLLRDKWRALLGRCTANYISDARLGALLKQWAGEDDKDDGPAKLGEGADKKLITVLEEDLDEETLREILMECLKDVPETDDKEKEAQRRGVLARCLPGRGSKNQQVSTDDIVAAAKYIVDRFGQVPVDAGDDEGIADDEQEPAGALPGALVAGGGFNDAALEKERDQLAQALERLADVQRELADGQRNLMAGQKQLAEQQGKLVALMNEPPPTPPGQ